MNIFIALMLLLGQFLITITAVIINLNNNNLEKKIIFVLVLIKIDEAQLLACSVQFGPVNHSSTTQEHLGELQTFQLQILLYVYISAHYFIHSF
jgi:hypothetical protein